MTWPGRLLRGGLALGGTAVFAWSYGLPTAPALPMGALALSAGLSWPVLGLVLWRSGGSAKVGPWADLCLGTMSAGMPFLLLAAALNLAEWRVPAPVHAALVLVSGLVMTAVFLRAGAVLGLTWGRALVCWGLGLHLPFLGMFLLLRGRG